MTGAQSLVRSLEEIGCEVVFGIPGGTILPAYDPLLDSTRVRHVLVRHEQGAGHAATGYAQATGKVGVCMATSGPGATNLVTPIADAHMDSIPIVAITGQQSRALIGTDAFQEADITGITMPITKHNMLVTDADGDPAGDRRGVPPRVHRPTRPGAGGHPQGRAAGADDVHLAAGAAAARLPADDPAARQADPRGRQAHHAPRRKPVLYVGGGVLKAEASAELLRLAEQTGIPVVTTLMARGAFPDSHRQHVGMPGMHGTVAAVAAMQRSDLLVALGARFDDRVTGAARQLRARTRKIVHADIDPAEISKNRRADVPIVGRLPRGDRRADRRRRGGAGRARRRPTSAPGGPTWTTLRETYPLGYDWPADGSLSPEYVIERIGADRRPGRGLRGRRRAAPDVGGAVHPLREAAHVAQLGRAGHHGLRRAGRDGREDGRARRRGLVHRRRRLLPDDQPGARHLRDRGHPDQGRRSSTTATSAWSGSGRTCSTRERYSQTDLGTHKHRIPDFKLLAEAMGCVGLRAESKEDVDRVIHEAMEINDRPVVIDFVVGADAQVWPMVAAGTGNDQIMAARNIRPLFDERRARGGHRRTIDAVTEEAQNDDAAPHAARCSSRTSPACSPACRGCSPGAASTSSRWPSGPPSTPTSPA